MTGFEIKPATTPQNGVSFYKNNISSLDSAIASTERNIEAIVVEANRLLESKRKLERERERLLQERNAARIAIRSLEDAE